MFKQNIQLTLVALAAEYPIVTITGPRQSGKTTLARNTFPKIPYVNLEEPDTRSRVLADPRGFFKYYSKGVILDEIQEAPELLSYLQSIVDDTPINGRFILTGSHQMQLHQAISQSLAGRTALLDLLPLTIDELQQAHIEKEMEEYLLTGFYPGIYAKNLNYSAAYRNYLKTYVERDVRQLINIKDLTSFQRFLQLVAGRCGSIMNVESLANDLGMANNTVKNWFSILEATYLLYRLQPYYENFGKRIIKSPKLYFADVGIASYLLGIETAAQMYRDRMRGHLFENMVLLELIKHPLNLGKDPRLFYYRDNHDNEVDVLLKQQDFLIPIEIKATATFSPSLLKNLHFFKKLAENRVPISFLVYNGDQEFKIENIHVLNFKNAAKIYDLVANETG